MSYSYLNNPCYAILAVDSRCDCDGVLRPEKCMDPPCPCNKDSPSLQENYGEIDDNWMRNVVGRNEGYDLRILCCDTVL